MVYSIIVIPPSSNSWFLSYSYNEEDGNSVITHSRLKNQDNNNNLSYEQIDTYFGANYVYIWKHYNHDLEITKFIVLGEDCANIDLISQSFSYTYNFAVWYDGD